MFGQLLWNLRFFTQQRINDAWGSARATGTRDRLPLYAAIA